MKTYNIASIAGDGIGKEVVPVAQKVLKKISEQHEFKYILNSRMIKKVNKTVKEYCTQ